MSNPLSKLVTPRFPKAAVGLEGASASVVSLERRGSAFSLKRAATMTLPSGLIRPSFEEQNISDLGEVADALLQLATSAGLVRQRRWSAVLPEAVTRTMILTIEGAPASRAEAEEILRWKTERAFGASVEELRVGREQLSPDAEGRARYLATAVREIVLAEYEAVFGALGWHTGLILPRHMGEERWLLQTGFPGDSLLVSSHSEGFTAVMTRARKPLIVRSIVCDPEDREDELYRLLLFYRDRIVGEEAEVAGDMIERLLVVGEEFGKERVSEIVNETLGGNLRSLSAQEVGLVLPSNEFSFDALAAPAGLATLAWA
ncbi:MAG TPA: hypothetical protein VK619_17045 [Pyrinomonadaceae bacterium]|nr:hypothetical protein [Pyrinomonadaceae bacterium]